MPGRAKGVLGQKKEALDVRGGNSYTNWAGGTKEHEQFKAALFNCNIHLIVTMRSKQDYVLEVNEKGKAQPRKVGLAPIQTRRHGIRVHHGAGRRHGSQRAGFKNPRQGLRRQACSRRARKPVRRFWPGSTTARRPPVTPLAVHARCPAPKKARAGSQRRRQAS
jgi:hypothetical protein